VLLNAPKHNEDMMYLGAGEIYLLNLNVKLHEEALQVFHIFLITVRIVEFMDLNVRKKKLAFNMMGLIIILNQVADFH
jgi:hypothetical protein